MTARQQSHYIFRFGLQHSHVLQSLSTMNCFSLATEVTLRDSPTVHTDGSSLILCFVVLLSQTPLNPSSILLYQCLTILYFSSSPLSAPPCLKCFTNSSGRGHTAVLLHSTVWAWFVIETENNRDNIKIQKETDVWHIQHGCCRLISGISDK